ncbi:MAG: MazG nucleotide pyrophosphohydrolase domain-containing protein [Planctomycetota bacterium]
MSDGEASRIGLTDLQELIRRMYGEKDAARGVPGTFMWLMEEVGELAAALREEDASPGPASEELAAEFADVLAWLATIANVANVDLEAAVRAKYGSGCPGCRHMVCECAISEKP